MAKLTRYSSKLRTNLVDKDESSLPHVQSIRGWHTDRHRNIHNDRQTEETTCKQMCVGKEYYFLSFIAKYTDRSCQCLSMHAQVNDDVTSGSFTHYLTRDTAQVTWM